MGRSKREKAVALTSTRKRIVGRDAKEQLLNDMRGLVEDFENIYIFSTENMRNVKLKELRAEWKDSRFYFGRKRIAQIAFGRTESEEHAQGLHLLAAQLVGNVGILFTNRPDAKVRAFFEQYTAADFARSGFVATESIRLPAGPLEMFVPEFEQRLRDLGMNVALKRSVVVLREEFVVCEAGEVLTPERAKILELLGEKLAEFRLLLLCHFNKSSGFTDFRSP